MYTQLIRFFIDLHNSKIYKGLFVLVMIAFFNGSLNFTVAATWNTMFTLSISKFLSLEDRPKSGKVMSPFIK